MYRKWSNCVSRNKENRITFRFDLNILKQRSVRLHNSCCTDLGRSLKMATDNTHSIDVVKRVEGIPTFPLTAKAVLWKVHRFKNL